MLTLLNFDQDLFHLINYDWSNPVFDLIFPIFRNKYIWFPLYIFIISFLLINFKKQGLIILTALSITVGLADATSSHLIKKNVQRMRPCKIYQQPQEIKLLVSCGSGYSFPSSHAANHFSIAIFFFLLLAKKHRWLKYALMFWAMAISYAQVYVGVHYPTDVLAGGMLGGIIAIIVFKLFAIILVKGGRWTVDGSQSVDN